MSKGKGWIYFDGPEPEVVREFLDLLRDPPKDPPPLSREDEERLSQRVMKSVDETISRRAASLTSGKLPAKTSPFVEHTPVPESNPQSEPETARWVSKQSPPAPKPPPSYVEITEEVPVFRAKSAEPSPPGATSIPPAMVLPPFLREEVEAGAVSVPHLTIKQYASLHAELSLSPERSTEIHLKYFVPTPASRVALDEHWRAHFEKHPAARAMFERAFAEYKALLMRSGTPR